jgi:hypothetical protein
MDLAALKAKLAQTKASLKKAGTTIKPKQGKNRYVILPPYDGENFHHNFGQHFIKDATDKVQAIYVCANRTHDEPCDICNAMAEAQRTIGATNPETAEVIKKAYAQQQFLVGVLALDSDQPETPQVLQLGKRAFEQLCSVIEEWAETIFDPSNPQIIVVERSGTGQMDTSYTVQVSPARHALKKKLEPINLAEFVKQESEAAQKKALLALQAVSGAGGAPRLAGPAKSKDTPATKPADADFEDVPDFAPVPAPAPRPAATAAAPAAPAITDDIDALLGDLEAA